MSVKKQCYSCKHYSHGACLRCGSEMCGKEMKYWELSDDAKADVLHDAEPEHDAVSHPSHYTSGGIECIDCIKAALGENFIGFLIGNVIKYTYRYKDKNGVTDLEKASVYLKWAIEEMKKNETT